MGALLNRASYLACDGHDDVRAIVVTGAGRAFCAGADFSSGASPFDASAGDSAFSAAPITQTAFELRKPVIAAVNGHAIGIGLTSALQADVRISVWCKSAGGGDTRLHVALDVGAVGPALGVFAEVLLTGRTSVGPRPWRSVRAEQVLDHAGGGGPRHWGQRGADVGGAM